MYIYMYMYTVHTCRYDRAGGARGYRISRKDCMFQNIAIACFEARTQTFLAQNFYTYVM